MSRVINFLAIYNISMYEGFCVLIPGDTSVDQIESFIEKVRLYEIYVFHNIICEMHMFLFISEEPMPASLLECLKNQRDLLYKNNIMIGIGSRKQDVMGLHDSYLEAMEKMNAYKMDDALIDHLHEGIVDEQLQYYYVKVMKDYLLRNMDTFISFTDEINLYRLK